MAGMKIKDAERLVASQMPGWRIVKWTLDEGSEAKAFPRDFKKDAYEMKIDTGPSLAQLRSKFLGFADVTDEASENSFAVEKSATETFLIQPKAGGPTKTVDVRDGKVIVVQG